jgi:hypothetical protein
MKLKQYKDLLNEDRVGFDDIDQPYDDETGDSGSFYYGDDEDKYYDQEEEDDEEENDEDVSPEDADILEHLASLIRQMIKNTNIDNYYVSVDNYNLSIQFVLNKKERFSNLMKILGLLKKLNTDTLIQYDSELDLWETKDGNPLLTVDFYYDSKKPGAYKKEDVPF